MSALLETTAALGTGLQLVGGAEETSFGGIHASATVQELDQE